VTAVVRRYTGKGLGIIAFKISYMETETVKKADSQTKKKPR
jgi:nucleoside diphosphate kinase